MDRIARPVRWYLQAVLEKSDTPTGQDDRHQRAIGELEVSVSGEGHEHVRTDQQQSRGAYMASHGHVRQGNGWGLLALFRRIGHLGAQRHSSE
jgi:hypothetical protein